MSTRTAVGSRRRARPRIRGRSSRSTSAKRRARSSWLKAQAALDLQDAIVRILSTGPVPHPYRRIKRDGSGYRLGLRDWRVRFELDGKRVRVLSLASGYKAKVL